LRKIRGAIDASRDEHIQRNRERLLAGGMVPEHVEGALEWLQEECDRTIEAELAMIEFAYVGDAGRPN